MMMALPLFSAPAVSALDINRYLCLGVNLGDSSRCDGSRPTEDATDDINFLARQVINVLTLIVGIISVIMIIIGGLRYITSGGDSNNVTGAKNTILYAIVGIVIVVAAQAIVSFILNRLSTDDSATTVTTTV